ncbi:MAG: flagellar motor protein MotB [Alphaproteobacteria bacterium]
MAGRNEQQVIIVKKVKGGGHPHHGGAWKVAYADFVTAMMAFFLLLWLLNATTDEQKLGISNYFSPEAVSAGESGAGLPLAGRSVATDGALNSSGGPAEGQAIVPMPPSPTLGNELDNPEDREIDEETLAELLAEREQKQFEAAEEELRQAIQSVPSLAELADSLLVEQTAEGLRIQLVDQEQVSMFPLGSAEPQENTRRLARLIAEVVAKLPNRISVTGHTDALPYKGDNGYDNWDLSTDRANAARRLLVEAGLPGDRIAGIKGRSDTELLLPDDPTSPRNRRISIVLLRESAPGGTEPPEIGPLPPAN